MSRLKDVPELQRDGSNLNAVMQAVREAMQTFRGYRGDPLDKALTIRDLSLAAQRGLMGGGSLNSGVSGGSNPVVAPGGSGTSAIDPTPPPTPTGLEVSSGITAVFVSCDTPVYTQGHGHGTTVVYGAKWPTGGTAPTFPDAVELFQFQGPFSSYTSDPATRWCIWIKWRSVDGFLSTDPAGGTNGMVVTTGQDVALLLEALNGEIRQSQLYADLGARINLIDGPSSMAGSVAKQVYDEAQARNAAIASEASARAAAILVETNNRNLAIDTINATLSDISGTPDYSAGVTYTVDQIVKYGGGLYKATATTTGNLPTNAAYWTKIGDYASLGDAVAGHSLILNDHETRITNTAGDVVAVASRTTAIEAAVNSPTSGLSTKSSVAYVDTAKADAISTAASATQLVQSHLDTTNANVTTAQGTANTAVSNAATAQTTANTAVNAAAAVATRASNLEASVNNGSTGLNSKASVGYVDTAKADAISAAATASQTLVSSIKVGGRNLLLGSQDGSGWHNWFADKEFRVTTASTTEAGFIYSRLMSIPPGIKITLSFETKKIGSVVGGEVYLLSGTWGVEGLLNSQYELSTDWVRKELSYTTPAGWVSPVQIRFDHNGGDGTSSSVCVRNVKLEYGDKATDWTPAPEDVDAAIGVAMAAISSEASTRATADETEANARTTLASTLRTEAAAGNAAAVTAANAYVDTNFYTKTNRDIAEAANNVTLRAEFASADATTLSTAQNYTYSKATIDGANTTQTNTITAAYQAADTATYNSAKAYVEGYSYSIANADTAIAGAVQTVSARLNAGGDVNASIATAKTTADAAVTATDAVASNVTTLQSQMTGATGSTLLSSIQTEATTRATQTGELYAQYTVKLDVGGKVSGYGLASTGPTGAGSAFAVRADRFYVAAPEGTPDYSAYVDAFPDLYSLWGSLPIADKIWNGYNHWFSAGQYEGRLVPASTENFIPFVVQTTPAVIDGVYILPGVYINDAYIKNGTITNAKIGNAAIDSLKVADAAITTAKIGTAQITTAKIGDAAITTAKIGDAQITTAKIKDLAVDTLKIAGMAVTVPAFVSSPASDVSLQYVLTGTTGELYSVFILVSLVQAYFSTITLTIDGTPQFSEGPRDGTLCTRGIVVMLGPGTYDMRLWSTDTRNSNGSSIYVLATKR